MYDREDHLLLAPNAGSNTVSVFSVNGATLHLNQIVGSGGPFPASIAVHDDVAYVLDAGLAGYVQGYRIAGGTLNPIAGSQRSLGLANTNPPGFLQSPAQVGFSPDGSKLVITMKGNRGGSVDVFGVSDDGQLSAAPTATAVGGVAFAFVFDSEGRLVIVNAAFGNLSTYNVERQRQPVPYQRRRIIRAEGRVLGGFGRRHLLHGQHRQCEFEPVRHR